MSMPRLVPMLVPAIVGLSFVPLFGVVEAPPPPDVLIGGVVPSLSGGDPARARLYDNTAVCTVSVQAIALGGQPPNPMSVLDWFTTAGGNVTGFDLFVLNGASSPQNLTLQFYHGTNAHAFGDADPGAFFRTLGAPFISPIPPWDDPATGRPGVIRVSVDYVTLVYRLTGLSVDPATGQTIETPLNGVSGEFLGETIGRLPFSLPPGPVGVNVRLGGEPSVCNGGDPQAGPVLARGGSGNEDGLHLIGIYSTTGPANCSPPEYPQICDDPGWVPFENVTCDADADCAAIFGLGVPCLDTGVCAEQRSVPCTGGDFCVLDLPHYGVALTLFAGPDDDEDGNNEIDTADAIDLDAPDPCTSGLVTVQGFLGDNGQPNGPPTAVDFFDCDNNGVVDFADFGCFQRCFGPNPSDACRIHDQDQDQDVDLNDFQTFLTCADDPGLPECSGELPPLIVPLQDVDIFAVGNLSAGHVLSALVEGETSPVTGPLWDPYLRLFADTGAGVEELAFCDDYYRFALDAFMTTEVPPGVNTVFVAISSEANAVYDPQDPASIAPLDPVDAGGYALTVAVTDPACVQDDGGGGLFDCHETRHEPDDWFAAADAQGAIAHTILVGAVGDGAFAELGQDFDLYRIELDGDPLPLTQNTRSLTAQVKDVPGFGFQTTIDLAMALYGADGELIAVGDQSARGGSFDQTRPLLGVNVCGSDVSPPTCENPSSDPGVYYLAVFGTDRVTFDENGAPLDVAIPPSILSFPHGDGVGCTNACDIRPTLPGRVNRPGPPLVGRDPPQPNLPPNSATLQCYRIVISTSAMLLEPNGLDVCESSSNGDDSIPDACGALDIVADRLGGAPIMVRTLGNGRFGGQQGDVDFYELFAQPGQLVSLNISDSIPPGNADNRVRSYLAWYLGDGCTFALHDYSLEHFDPDVFILDNISDELAATVVGTVPDDGDGAVYAMVGVDAGNLDPAESTPFDALHPGMTLSRRFQTNVMTPRPYRMAVAFMDPVGFVDTPRRMFAAVHRGLDDHHAEPFVGDPAQSTCERFPPVLEIDPATGGTLAVLDGAPFFDTCRAPDPTCQMAPDGCPLGVTANPAIAYDGVTLFVTVERCTGGPPPCASIDHQLFRINPDLSPGDDGFVNPAGEIELDNPSDALISGMVEVGGFLWSLDATSNRIRFWDKDLPPNASNGGESADLTLLSGSDPSQTDFDDLSGDVGTDGVSLYVGCFHEGSSIGICVFSAELTPDGHDADFTFIGVVEDPLTNEMLIPGPRLGGLDFLDPGVMVTADRNGPVVQHWDMSPDTVRAFEMPLGILVDRVSIR